LEVLEPHSLGMPDPVEMSLPTCYHIKYGRSTSNGMGVGRDPQNLWDTEAHPLGWGMAVIVLLCQIWSFYF